VIGGANSIESDFFSFQGSFISLVEDIPNIFSVKWAKSLSFPSPLVSGISGVALSQKGDFVAAHSLSADAR
jgi:hypothetical protein